MLSVGYCIAGDLLDWTHVAVKVKLWGYRLELRKRLGAKEYRRTWLFSSTSFFSCLVENASEKVNCCLLFLSSCVVDLLLEVDENGDDEKDEDAASLVQNQPVGRHSFITAKGIFTCWSNLSKLSLRWRCEFSSFLPQLCSQFFYKGISFSTSIFFATFWLGQRKDGLLLFFFFSTTLFVEGHIVRFLDPRKACWNWVTMIRLLRCGKCKESFLLFWTLLLSYVDDEYDGKAELVLPSREEREDKRQGMVGRKWTPKLGAILCKCGYHAKLPMFRSPTSKGVDRFMSHTRPDKQRYLPTMKKNCDTFFPRASLLRFLKKVDDWWVSDPVCCSFTYWEKKVNFRRPFDLVGW